MPDAPPVTVVDPSGDGRRDDLLVSGDERAPHRLPRRAVAGAAVLLLLVAAVTAGVKAVRDERRDREQQRVADAAFAAADVVHLRSRLQSVSAFEAGSQRLDVLLALDPVGGRYTGPRDRVADVLVEGAGLSSLGYEPDEEALRAGVAQLGVGVDCGAVAAGAVPTAATVVVLVVPASGAAHPQRLEVDPAALRQGVLDACALPDPDATTRVEASAQRDGLLLLVEAVARAGAPVVVESLELPGFEVLPDRFALPYEVAPGSGALLGLRVRLVDCAAARAGGLRLQVRLTDDRGPAVREPGDLVSQPQPGDRPAAELLLRLVDEGC